MYDVIVAGGGMSGVMAAVAAARGQRRVCLLERGFMLGGMATSGLVQPVTCWGRSTDATGDCALANAAGADCFVEKQGVSLMFILGGVNKEELFASPYQEIWKTHRGNNYRAAAIFNHPREHTLCRVQFPKVGRGCPERVQGSGLKSGVTGPVAISVSTPTPERSRVPGAGATFWELHPFSANNDFCCFRHLNTSISLNFDCRG